MYPMSQALHYAFCALSTSKFCFNSFFGYSCEVLEQSLIKWFSSERGFKQDRGGLFLPSSFRKSLSYRHFQTRPNCSFHFRSWSSRSHDNLVSWNLFEIYHHDRACIPSRKVTSACQMPMQYLLGQCSGPASPVRP